MADTATITVNDGAAVPVAHAFDPAGFSGDSNNVAKYQNKVAAIFSGRETLQLRMKQSPKVRTVMVNLRIPRTVTETINDVSVTRVVDYATANAEVLIPLDWTPALAKNARVLLSNVLAHAVLGLMIEDGEFVW